MKHYAEKNGQNAYLPYQYVQTGVTTFMPAIKEMNIIIPQQPSKPKSIAILVPISDKRVESRLSGSMDAKAEVRRKKSILTEIATKGPAHRAHTAIRLNTSAEFFITDAADNTIPEASL